MVTWICHIPGDAQQGVGHPIRVDVDKQHVGDGEVVLGQVEVHQVVR